MKFNKYIAILLLPALTSCNEWLREDGPMTNRVEDFFTSAETAIQVTNAAYVPLMWEYQSTYYSEFFFGDVLSDDALKGGQNISDMADVYDLENFKAITNNSMVLDFYRAQYQGISRANLALEQIPAMELDETLTKELRDRLVGEASFVRAYYYFRLVRLYGGVPIVKEPIYSSGNWKQPRAKVDDVYTQIVADLKTAEANLPLKSAYAPEDLGRATKGAAQAMLMKVYMYWGDYQRNTNGANATEYYAESKTWGTKFISEQAGEYSLCPNYADNFTLSGENGQESVFEIQYMEDGMSDYGEGNGFTRGTFTTILTRSRSAAFSSTGWGFNHPTQNLYNEFEAGDPRRDASILVPTDDQITTPADEIYLGNRNLGVKRAIMNDTFTDYVVLNDSHHSRSPINYITIRLADVYLMYAEASLRDNDPATAKIYLELVRARARGTEDILPAFPGYAVPDYKNSYAMHQLTDTPEDLEMALRHERRVELAMESHRWFDLCRWGIVKEVMDAYAKTETAEAQSHMTPFVAGKHELMPIPQEEVRLGGIDQNPGY